MSDLSQQDIQTYFMTGHAGFWKIEYKDQQDPKLYADDDMDTCTSIAKTVLEEVGFIVDTADDGIIAVDKIKKAKDEQYDLILMDIQMPLVDGYTATKQIRNLDTKMAKIPIIAMTANAFEEDKEKALVAGMNVFNQTS